MADQSNIIRRLVFRLVRKHIAGTTTGSVLKGVKQLNEKKLHATVTFLSEHATNANKIRYNTNTYVEFIRQISRLRLNADVSLRLSQIGYDTDPESCVRSLDQIAEVARKSGVMIWIEDEDGLKASEIAGAISKMSNASGTLGLEVPVVGKSLEKASLNGFKNIRLTSYTKLGKESASDRILDGYMSSIKALGRGRRITVLEQDTKMIQKIVEKEKRSKKDFVFEVPLGYSKKRINKLSKMKFNLSVYVPYGSDWVPYAIDKLTEGHIRDIAKAVLDGEHEGDSDHP